MDIINITVNELIEVETFNELGNMIWAGNYSSWQELLDDPLIFFNCQAKFFVR